MRPASLRLVDRHGVEHMLDIDTIIGYRTRETLPLTRKVDTLWHRAAVDEGWQLEPGNPWPNGFHGILIALDAAPPQSGCSTGWPSGPSCERERPGRSR